MKKRMFIFCFLISISLSLTAQTNSEEKEDDSIKMYRIRTKDFPKNETKTLQMVTVDLLGNIQPLDSVETLNYYYSFIKSQISDGSLCHIYNCPKEAINESFKNYDPIVIPEYFVFGALGSTKLQQQTDILQNTEISHPFILYLTDYIRQNLGVNVSIGKNQKDVFNFYSPELAQIINRFFDEETGELKFDSFDSNEKICS